MSKLVSICVIMTICFVFFQKIFSLVLNTVFNTYEPSISAASSHFFSHPPKSLIFFCVKFFSLQINFCQLYYISTTETERCINSLPTILIFHVLNTVLLEIILRLLSLFSQCYFHCFYLFQFISCQKSDLL